MRERSVPFWRLWGCVGGVRVRAGCQSARGLMRVKEERVGGNIRGADNLESGVGLVQTG